MSSRIEVAICFRIIENKLNIENNFFFTYSLMKASHKPGGLLQQSARGNLFMACAQAVGRQQDNSLSLDERGFNTCLVLHFSKRLVVADGYEPYPTSVE